MRLQAAEAMPKLVMAVYTQFPPVPSAAAPAVPAGPGAVLVGATPSPELKHVLDIAIKVGGLVCVCVARAMRGGDGDSSLGFAFPRRFWTGYRPPPS